MASATPYYGFAIFDFGDQLDAPLNVQGEIDRFLVIDKQMYALYKIFGSGVISGWQVEDNGFSDTNGISVTITPGTGIIRYIACESTFTGEVDGLPPNTTVNIYAVLRGSTAEDREIDFVYSSVPLGDSSILLAQVTTGNNSNQTINNSVQQLIGFEQIIQDLINAHHHRGTPTKIDLQLETKNQLPGAKIESVDAQQITSGVFDIGLMPQLNHDDLKFNGLLTHAELDAFVQSLTQTNKQLLGEVASVNLLKHILFMKYKYADIDKYMINELALIPGITPNSFIDFESSGAYINLEQGCISGSPPAVGEFVDVNWDSETSFFNAYNKVNVTVGNNVVTLTQNISASLVIEDFEEVSATGVDIPGFVKTMSVITNDLDIVSESSTSLVAQGFYSGKVTTYQQQQANFTKTFTNPQDWSQYNQLLADVKTLVTTHGPVYCYFVNGTGDNAVNSPVYLLLGNDEVTTNPDPTLNSFAVRDFDISTVTRNNVTQFVIFTADTDLGFEFYLDNIRVVNTALYFPQGTINLRYSSSAPVTFYAVFYDATTPAKTQVQVNVRTASDTTLLTRAAYTAPINSGDVIALSGTDAEIQVTLLTTDPTISPTLNSVKLRLLVKSEQNGFYIQNTSDWALGTTKNLTIAPLTGDLGQLEITTPINVGGIAFSYLQAIREIDSSNVAVFGFSGVRLPISPPQAFNWANNPYVGFDQPVSVVRQIDKTYLVADMNNDRVVLMDSSGNLIQGFASVNVTDANFYAFCSSYNPTTGVLTIILSQGVDNTSVSLPLISIYIGTTQIILGATDTIQQNNKNNQILEILLSEDKQAQLNGATQGRVTVNFTTGAFPAPFSSNPNSLGLIGVLGIQCFLGNITFIDGIQHPVAANILANGDWIIANSTIEYTPPPSGATGTTAALKSNPTSISVTANSQATATVSGGTGPYNIKTGPDSSIATASLSGNQVQIQGTATGKTNVVIQDSSTLPLTLSIAINVVAGTTAAPTVVTIASLLQINPKTQAVDFSSSILSYSDFTLGAVEEVNADRIAVAGLVVDPASLNSNTGSSSSGSTGPVIDPTLPPAEYYRQSAIAALSTYRGIVGIIDKPSNNMIFQYLSPDGLYASDVDLDEDGNLIVAESSFTGAAGRVIVLDPFGNIIRLYGEGMFGTINDAKSVGNGNILISV